MRIRYEGSLVRFDTADLFLLGDVHGRFDRTAQALARVGLQDGVPANATLIQVGDLIDRGREDERLPERLATATIAQQDLFVPGPWPDGAPVTLQSVLDGTVPWEPSLLRQERIALLGALDTIATLRGFMALERRSSGRVLCLLGNHDLDLLLGNYYYFDRQKSYLLALLGVPPKHIAAHARTGLSVADLSARAPELAWLAQRPVLAAGGGIVAVHGGPTRALINRLATLGITSLDGLASWLDAAWLSRDHEAFCEGNSLFSPDRPEDNFVVDAGLRDAFLRLAQADLLAVGHSAFLHPRQWEPRLLAEGRILKLDTGMKRGGPAYVVHRFGGSWSATCEDGAKLCLAPTPHFSRSAYSSHEIGSKLYAVHGTRTLPWDDHLRAPIQGMTSTFRPGVHFALGSLSNGMDTDGFFRFAVLVPLGNLAPQLLCVSPADTFVVGDLALSSETVVVVPEDTSTAHLSRKIPVLEYPTTLGLRRAVAEALRARDAWFVELPNDFDLDSAATMDGQDINTSEFFAPFLDEHAHVSFGGHAATELGDAGLFGMIDRLLQGLMRPYSGAGARAMDICTRIFAVAMVDDYLGRTDRLIQEFGFDGNARFVYWTAARQARERLAAVNLDLRYRHPFTRKLESASGAILQDAAGRSVETCADTAPDLSDAGGGRYPDVEMMALFAAEVFSVLPLAELRLLIDAKPEIVAGMSLRLMYLAYAVRRWLNVRSRRAVSEGLDGLIAAAIATAAPSELRRVKPILQHVTQVLRPNSNRESDALAMLATPAVRAHLIKYGPLDPSQPPASEMTLRFKNLGAAWASL